MWSLFNLPKYEITVWLKICSSTSRIEKLLCDLAREEPYQSAKSDDAKDYHWGFESSDEAIAVLENFMSIAEDSTVIVLRFASRDKSVDSFTVKDTRRVLH